MSNISTSYQFHHELESPVAFVRREWKALAVFGGGFAIILAATVLAIDPAFFYSRLSTDPLLYYLKGMAFAETGHTAARLAVNRPPFHYVALPGVLRSPFMMAFKDFDSQLRAIQFSNIVLLVITATMFAFILSWIVPRKWHWLAIGFTFGFMLLAPDWVANVFVPLADAPYAVFSTGFIILATRVITSDRPLRAQPLAIAGAIILFVLTFLTRFTAPLLLIYIALLAAGRMRHGALTGRKIILIGAVAAVGITILTLPSWETIKSRYLWIPGMFISRADKPSIIGNVFASVLPSQIIPVFNLGFSRPPVVDTYHVQFGTSPAALILVAIGLAISATIFVGMWRSRNRLTPAVWYSLTALVILSPVIPSTSRYLMAYQPFMWIFFYLGIAGLLARFDVRVAARSQRLWTIATLAAIFFAGFVYLRAQRIGGTAADRRVAIPIAGTRRYVDEVGSTFRALRNYLESLPRDRTWLVSEQGAYGRWTVISGFDYYRPDSVMKMAVANHDMYLLVECGTVEVCQDFPAWDALLRRRVGRYGNFSYDLTFSKITPHGKARVYRIRNAQ